MDGPLSHQCREDGAQEHQAQSQTSVRRQLKIMAPQSFISSRLARSSNNTSQAAFTEPPFLPPAWLTHGTELRGWLSAGARSLVPLVSEGVSLHHVATRGRSASSPSAWSTLEWPRNRQGAHLSPSAQHGPRRRPRAGRTSWAPSVASLLLPALWLKRFPKSWQRTSLQHSMLAKAAASEYTGRDAIYTGSYK